MNRDHAFLVDYFRLKHSVEFVLPRKLKIYSTVLRFLVAFWYKIVRGVSDKAIEVKEHGWFLSAHMFKAKIQPMVSFFLWYSLLLLGANRPLDCNKLSKLLKIKQILHNSLLQLLQVNKEGTKGICIFHVKDQTQNILTSFSRKAKIVDFSFANDVAQTFTNVEFCSVFLNLSLLVNSIWSKLVMNFGAQFIIFPIFIILSNIWLT